MLLKTYAPEKGYSTIVEKKKPQHYIGSHRFKPSGKLTIEVDGADVVE